MSENPYAAPESDVNVEDGKRKRPILVWVIFIFASLGLLGILSHFAMVAGVIPLEGALGEYYASTGMLDHALVIFGVSYGFWSALMLFKLKRSALFWFLGQIPISIFSTLYTFSNDAWLKVMQETQQGLLVSLAPSYIYLLLVVGYVYYLYRKGTLQ